MGRIRGAGCCEKRKKREEKERRWSTGLGQAGPRERGGREEEGLICFFSLFSNPF
jgi:hypothetical protein